MAKALNRKQRRVQKSVVSKKWASFRDKNMHGFHRIADQTAIEEDKKLCIIEGCVLYEHTYYERMCKTVQAFPV